MAWPPFHVFSLHIGGAQDRPENAEAPLVPDPAAGLNAEARQGEILAVLQELAADDAIIVSGRPNAVFYVQCRQKEDGSFWCEAVSNEFLDAGDALGEDQMSRLVTFGWNPPDGGGRPNWWRVERVAEDVAALMVRTLNEIYGVPVDVPLSIETVSA